MPRRKLLYGMMVVCREVISRKCCDKTYEWFFSSKMGTIQRPLKLESKRGLCTKAAQKCDISRIMNSNYNLNCLNDDGEICPINNNQVDINCQCKVKLKIKKRY